ncbi:TadE/TadG family type IV pilus assembly protein [Burkholderia diffusa]|uniref:TadE/TadG family type IV pilus assembly protein n=1 Tax=Burkholderia diffusa TaxID=488732 RepID=UPI00075E5F99|nr:TadE/TadG family type IV pilus assembly protein [Burkholderia diffusa]KVC45123.1 pilus assembly protein TadE [Burkholderia diffusa]KVG33919.1 pilus assembly protein TadE [Burkholderia diffusa]
MKRQRKRGGYRLQRGATAVEFAIIFPLFFVICYAIICFGMVFVIQQSLTFAASEGARAGLNYAPDLATRTAKAQATAKNVVSWLNISAPNVVVQAPACKYDASLYCLSVTVSYSPQSWVTTMPFVGTILTQPLTSTAVVQISQSLLQ